MFPSWWICLVRSHVTPKFLLERIPHCGLAETKPDSQKFLQSAPLLPPTQALLASWPEFFFFFSFFRILFTYFFLCWVFIAAQAFSLVVASRGYSLVAMRGLIVEASLVAEHRLQGTLASVAVACRLWSIGSIAVVHWLSYSAACGIFPDQGSNPCLLHWQVDSLPIELPGKSLTWVFWQLHNQSVSIYCLEFRNLARTQNCKLGRGKKLYLDFQKPLTGNLHFLWL